MWYAFDDYILDAQRYELHRAGNPVPLRPKPFEVLSYLLAHRDRIVPKDELLAHLWAGRFVGDSTLNSCIKEVRRAIGDSGAVPHLLRTVRGRGYRFIAPVEELPNDESGTMVGTPQSRTDTVLMLLQDAHDMAPVPPLQGAGVEPDGRAALDATAAEGLLRRGAATPVKEWKVVTVLCCAPAEAPVGAAPLEPEVRYLQMHDIYALARKAVQRYGGTLQPVVGERIMAVFGAPVAQEDHAQRAALAALELQRRLREARADRQPQLGDVPALRLGLHTGVVAVGGLEDNPATSGAVVGNTVTGAIALQEHAAPETILCSEATARLVQEVVRVAGASLVPVVGQVAPMPAYTVLRRRVRRRPLGPRERRVWTPFVGRARELQTLQALLAHVEEGWGQVVGVVGEPGIGKSRLVYEFHRSLHGRAVTYLAAGCISHGAATPYLPIVALLRPNCGLTERDAPPTIATKVRASLAEVGLAPDAEAPFLLHLLGVSAGTEGLAGLSPQAIKARTIEILVQLAVQGAHRRPLVLEVENLHWIDPSSEEVLGRLVEQLVGTRILLLLTYRPGYRPPWIDKSYATQLALPRLEQRDSRRVLQAIVHTASVPEAMMQVILARAEGNPLFLEELAYTFVEQGGSHRSVGLPTTIQTVLASRLDRLPLEAKRLLQLAAAIGKDVAVPLLEATAQLPSAALQRGLAHLEAVELLYETTRVTDRTVTFKHALIREAAYQSLLRSTRQEYHERIAQVLEARFPETAEGRPELLAHHYTEAGLVVQAIAYWQQAGQRAVERSANLEAIAHLTKGLELLATLPDTPERLRHELDMLTSLGPAVTITRGPGSPSVEQVYARARELCQQVEQPRQLFPVLWGLWRLSNYREELQRAGELGKQLLTLAHQVQDRALLLEAHHALWPTLFYLGELAAARGHLEQGMALYDPQQHRSHAFLYGGHDPGLCCHSYTAWTLWALGYPDQALKSSDKMLALAQELAYPKSLADALSAAVVLHQFLRERHAVQQTAEALMALATEQGNALQLARGIILHGWTLFALGQRTEGMVQMRHGLGALQTTGGEVRRPLFLALLAGAYGAIGQIEEGLHVLAGALAAVEKTEGRFYEAELNRLKGELLLRQAPLDEDHAETCFRQALDVARRQQAKALELRGAMSLSRLWQRQGKREQARQLLADVYNWFTEGFDTADLQEARAQLAELS
jgi:predicted ATPase/DNA-binding winged helix-turn-helix (wHTH) protein/class 3 adenylate cyclase